MCRLISKQKDLLPRLFDRGRRVVVVVFLVIGYTHSKAAAQNSKVGGIILKTHASARAEGMGNAQCAVAVDEAGALGFNPAGLAGYGGAALSGMYTKGLMDDAIGSINAHGGWGRGGAVGLGVLYYDGGGFDWDTGGAQTQSLTGQQDVVAGLTLSRGRPDGTGLSMGINGKYIRSTLLETYTAQGAAVDVGARFGLRGALKGLHLGASIRNVGTSLKYDQVSTPLPSYALVGAAWDIAQSAYWALLMAADAQYDLDNTWKKSCGVEILLNDVLAFRGGYRPAETQGAITAGVGVRLGMLDMDYAFVPREDLNSSHRITLSYNFHPPQRKPAAPPPRTSEKKPTSSNAASSETVKPAFPGNEETLTAQVVEIQKVGGRPGKVILNQGSNSGVKVGCQGLLLAPGGKALAGFEIRQVDPDLSLGEIIGLAEDIPAQATAVISIKTNGGMPQ